MSDVGAPDGSPRAVVAGHGGFAAGMISAVERICGLGARFRGVSAESLDAGGIEAALRLAIAEHGARVIFTDLPAGSCTLAARRVARTDAAVTIVTGANLPMLLEFALASGDDAAVDRVAEKGRSAIAVSRAAEGGGGR